MTRFLQGIFQSSTGATTGCSHASCALRSVYWNLFPCWTLFSRSIARGVLLPLFSQGSTTTATNPENYDFPKRQQTLVKQGRSDSSPGSLSCVFGLVYLKRDGNLDNAPPSILSNKLSKLLMTWRLYCNYGQVRVCDSLLCVWWQGGAIMSIAGYLAASHFDYSEILPTIHLPQQTQL